jgi:hypothetical protein
MTRSDQAIPRELAMRPLDGMGPQDWTAPDDGPPCTDCPEGAWKHRPVAGMPGRRGACLYCDCARFRIADAQQGLGL